jgi:hypothetical protein
VARADCVNGINGLRDDVCVIAEEAITAEHLDASPDLDWGAQGKGDRSFSESISDGLYSFGEGIMTGVGALGGFTMDDGLVWSKETRNAAWGGLLRGFGALAISGAPILALTLTPEKSVPVPLRGLKDWYTVTTGQWAQHRGAL